MEIIYALIVTWGTSRAASHSHKMEVFYYNDFMTCAAAQQDKKIEHTSVCIPTVKTDEIKIETE